jgi:hypothetical protein
MKKYTVTHFGLETTTHKTTASSPLAAIKKTVGDMGKMKSVRQGFVTKFLKADGSVWFEVRG